MIEGLLMNTEEINQLWAEVCSRVKSYEGIIGPQVDALFSQLFPQAASDGFMMLTANTEFIKNFIERHYIDHIKRALEEIRGVPFDVLIGIDESQAPAAAPAAPAAAGAPNPAAQPAAPAAAVPAATPAAAPQPAIQPTASAPVTHHRYSDQHRRSTSGKLLFRTRQVYGETAVVQGLRRDCVQR